MEVEKRSSKGGFFQLFDWNAKSRKKLFSNKSESSESSNQGIENPKNVAVSRLQQMKLYENGPTLSNLGSDYNYVSSASSDDGSGIKAPGVVARLMGLESLPTSDVSEAYSSPFFDTYSFRDSHTRTSTDVQSEHLIIDYDNTRNKLDGFSRNPVELRLQRVQNRPIDRFQTEMLPPKSARSISISHHRLLSPIKSPGFILTKDAACIMEAAAKIIEQSPQSTAKGRLSSFGSPSVPLRIRDLKEKLEVAQRTPQILDPSERAKGNRSAKYMKGQTNERGQRGLEDSQHLKPSVVPKQGGSRSLKDKGKSPSVVNQARTNISRKEVLTSSYNRSALNQKGDNNLKSTQSDKKQVNIQKNVQRRTSAAGTPDVLKQNNQKQNCASNKERVNMKPKMAPYQEDRKGLSNKSPFRVNKTVNKIDENSSNGAKKINLVASDTGRELLSSKSKNSGKKRVVNGDVNFNGTVDDVLITKSERSVRCNVSVDEFTNWDVVDGKSGMDVVSFTFTSPIKKSASGSQASGQFMEKNNSLLDGPSDDQPNAKISDLSSLGLNVIGSDALSVLLEQKLKELAHKVEPLDCNLVNQGLSTNSVSSPQDSAPSFIENSKFVENEKLLQLGLHHNNQGPQHDSGCSSQDELLLAGKKKWLESADLEESSSNSSANRSEYEKEHDCRYPTTISCQPSFSGGSCNSSGNMRCSSAETYEAISFTSAGRPCHCEDEMELSDSASSISIGTIERTDTATMISRIFELSPNWELKYVKRVLNNADLMLDDYLLGQTHIIITPDLFYNLENHKTGSDKTMEEFFKPQRKLLFDCISECLEFKSDQVSSGNYKAWIKLTNMFQKRERFAEELYKEMRGWISMTDLMVDEVVEKDMSTQYGKWVDFGTEEFEESSEVGNDILNSLIDEVVNDILS